jgi:uncharacterized protein (DUF1697 family)
MEVRAIPAYIAMLRGINVTGHNPVRMSRLRELFSRLGLEPARTYIQSGNVVFKAAKRSAADLSKAIEREILREFGFAIAVFCRTAAEMADVIQRHPLAKVKGVDLTRLHVSFLAEVPNEAAVQKLAGLAAGDEQLRCDGRELYLYCPDGYGNSKLANTNVERVLKVAATTRNWKTVNTLYEMSLANPETE